MYKIGKIVFLYAYLTVGGTVTSDTVLLTIPSGFRPKNAAYCTAHLFGGGEDGVNNFFWIDPSTGNMKQGFNSTLSIQLVGIIGSWYTEE